MRGFLRRLRVRQLRPQKAGSHQAELAAADKWIQANQDRLERVKLEYEAMARRRY